MKLKDLDLPLECVVCGILGFLTLEGQPKSRPSRDPLPERGLCDLHLADLRRREGYLQDDLHQPRYQRRLSLGYALRCLRAWLLRRYRRG